MKSIDLLKTGEKFHTDLQTGHLYNLKNHPGQGKYAILTVATPLVQTVALTFKAFEISAKLVSGYHFWGYQAEGRSDLFESRSSDAFHDFKRLCLTPITLVGMQFAAIRGLFDPSVETLLLYTRLEHFAYGNSLLLREAFKPYEENTFLENLKQNPELIDCVPGIAGRNLSLEIELYEKAFSKKSDLITMNPKNKSETFFIAAIRHCVDMKKEQELNELSIPEKYNQNVDFWVSIIKNNMNTEKLKFLQKKIPESQLNDFYLQSIKTLPHDFVFNVLLPSIPYIKKNNKNLLFMLLYKYQLYFLAIEEENKSASEIAEETINNCSEEVLTEILEKTKNLSNYFTNVVYRKLFKKLSREHPCPSMTIEKFFSTIPKRTWIQADFQAIAFHYINHPYFYKYLCAKLPRTVWTNPTNCLKALEKIKDKNEILDEIAKTILKSNKNKKYSLYIINLLEEKIEKTENEDQKKIIENSLTKLHSHGIRNGIFYDHFDNYNFNRSKYFYLGALDANEQSKIVIPERFWEEEDFCLQAFEIISKRNNPNYEFIIKKQKNNKQFLIKLIKQCKNIKSLEFILDKLEKKFLKNKENCILSILESPNKECLSLILNRISQEKWEDKKFCSDVINNGCSDYLKLENVLKKMSNEIINENQKKIEEKILSYIKEEPNILSRIDENYKNNENFLLRAIKNNPAVLKFVKEYRNNEDFLLRAIKANPEAFYFMKEKHDDTNFIIKAIKNNFILLTYYKDDIFKDKKPELEIDREHLEENPDKILTDLVEKIKIFHFFPEIKFKKEKGIDAGGLSRELIGSLLPNLSNSFFTRLHNQLIPTLSLDHTGKTSNHDKLVALGEFLASCLCDSRDLKTGPIFHPLTWKLMQIAIKNTDTKSNEAMKAYLEDQKTALFSREDGQAITDEDKKEISSLIQDLSDGKDNENIRESIKKWTGVESTKDFFKIIRPSNYFDAIKIITDTILKRISKAQREKIEKFSEKDLALEFQGPLFSMEKFKEKLKITDARKTDPKKTHFDTLKTKIENWINDSTEEDLKSLLRQMTGSTILRPDVPLKIELVDSDKTTSGTMKFATCAYKLFVYDGMDPKLVIPIITGKNNDEFNFR